MPYQLHHLTPDHARELDAGDDLRAYRDRFHIPPHPANPNEPSIYLCGNSLGLQPRALRDAMNMELDDWARLGVEGHFKERDGWYDYHRLLTPMAARLIGAREHEVAMMNSLTANVHLLMVSFYRPTPDRYKILIDGPCFPSDVYAVKSQIRFHGYDPDEALVWARPRDGEHFIREEDIETQLGELGHQVALVHFAGVNFFSGQHYDIPRITKAAHKAGAIAGWDLAHAAGNVPLAMHESGADYACWCTYKYLNSGPGAVAGLFVHERHLGREGGSAFEAFKNMPRFEGWWGNDPAGRFAMGEEFIPVTSADAWGLSNPPILALLPVKVSMSIFDEVAGGVGMDRLRAKSVKLTAYLEWLINQVTQRAGANAGFEIITPTDPARRGCQLSILAKGENPRALHEALAAGGVVCDFREPNVIRVAPVPLYNSFEDCWRFAEVLARASGVALV